MKDWIDEVLDDEDCSLTQMGIIEGLLVTSAANCLYRNINFNELTYKEANEIIRELRKNNRPTDPKHQYEQMRRNGMFGESN